MKRQIITIDEALCNGCGECITACAEGALQLVDGKAKLVKEQFCDGFGDCIGDCPTGALKIEEKDVPDYDQAATRAHVAATGGTEALAQFAAAAERHGGGEGSGVGAQGAARLAERVRQAPEHAADKAPDKARDKGLASQGPHSAFRIPHSAFPSGCPGSRMRMAPPEAKPAAPTPTAGDGMPAQVNPSELRQWPVQVHLVQPGAPFFQGKELVVMSTCGPIASADVHWRFLRGRSVVVGCPKLDDTAPYAEKLGAILREPSIPKVIVVRMEVPCCGGLTAIVRQAVALSGRSDLAFEEVTLGVDGAVR